ncbi:ABC-2 type transport system permease protein [Nakamurella panacisegetis]|uniref:ABC-2 type transport system permease protein n=1 Tax=Nakamurella panacisegetis TaxID=1090615 RepID=A0A1H0RLN7_9ACTN|nr:hypothetical protein [Nakamurella panacisegetis]SDP30413.1 ABC-2 type transport system permease protein [Nakamurella panacisegetis]
MVGVFAGLKWHLVSSRFRRASGAMKAWMIVGWCAAVVALAAVVVGLVSLRGQPDVARTLAVSLFTVQMVSWVLAPLVAFGVDETVDPAMFALLPLSTATLQRGLLVTSVIGYLPVANVVVLIGTAVALSSTWALLPIALIAAGAQLLLCVVISRAASAAMSGLMSGRRGRDLGMVLGSLIFLVYFGFSLALNRASVSGTEGARGSSIGNGARVVSRALEWGPNGALAALPSFVHDGNVGRLLAGLVTAAVGIGLGWWWWNRALRTSLTTTPSTSEGSAPVRRTDGRKAVASSLRGMILLIMARDRRLTWRDPMRRIPWVTVAALAVVWPLLVVPGHGSLFAVAFPAAMIGMQAGNQYAVEGTGLWLHMVAFADRTRARGEVLGHSLFAIVPGTVVVVAAVIVQAVIRHDLQWVPPAIGVCLALMCGSVASAGYTSARLPYAMRQSRKSMFANSIPGQKARTTGSVLAAVGGAAVIALPSAALVVLAVKVSPAFGWAALLVGPLTGAVAIVLLSARAASIYLARMPEILATVAVGDRS